ncbi:acyltransferase family protein [Shimia biformata]|uniref:acyltransferase family protein n=1 Tax=Shimia biformata TaxID=1294299 RepID=UPI00194E4CF7|nr:acyltransferase family protein [Shimia biformata]
MEYLVHPNAQRLLNLYKTFATLQLINFHIILSIARFSDTESIVNLQEWFPNILSLWWQGNLLDTLFAISAFLAGCMLFKEYRETGTVDVREYYLKRVSRLLPLYYLALLLYGLGQGRDFWDMLQAAFFVQYLFGPTHLNPVIPVGWTMEMMMFVFVLLPFAVIGLMKVKRPMLWMVAATLVTLAFRYGYILQSGETFKFMLPDSLLYQKESDVYFEIYFRIWFRISGFIIGLAFAYLFMVDTRFMERLRNDTGFRWLHVVLAWVLTITGTFLPVQDPNSIIYAGTPEWLWKMYWALSPAYLAYASMVFISVLATGRITEKAKKIKWWDIPMALASRNLFAVYLFHFPCILLAAVIWFRSTDRAALIGITPTDWAGVFFVATLLTFAIAIPLTTFVEIPVQRLLRRKFSRKEQPKPAE